MIRRLTLTMLAVLAAVSCGTYSQYAGLPQYQDGIYYKASDYPVQEQVEPLSEEDFKALAAERIRQEKLQNRDTIVIIRDRDDDYGYWNSPYSSFYFGFGYPYMSPWYGYRFGWG